MNSLLIGFKALNSMLMEVDLKERFPKFNVGDVINITLDDGTKHSYEVQSNVSGKILMKDRVANKEGLQKTYVLTRDSLINGVLTIHEYDNTITSGIGKEFKFNLKEFETANKGGKLEYIDLITPEIQKNLNDFKQVLSKIKENDVIVISTGEEVEGKDDLVNNLFLKVIKKDNKWVRFELFDIDIEGPEMQSKLKTIENRHIYISNPPKIAINGNHIDLLVYVSANNVGKEVILKNIYALEKHAEGEPIQADKEEKEDFKYSKEELLDALRKDKIYQDMVNKQPGFWQTLAGASPKGIYQLSKMLHNAKISAAYLVKGKIVTFRLNSDNIFGNADNKLLNDKDKYYEGKLVTDTIIKVGNKNTNHWEIELKEELDNNNYSVIIKFCDTKGRCEIKDKGGTIEIIDIK